MSFRDSLRAALETSTLGLYDTWAEFYAACPLSRELLVKHNSDGSERVAPERDPGYYEDKFFSGDSLGVVWFDQSKPVTGVVLRLESSGVVEETLRIGQPVKATGLRRALWDIGIRTLVFRIQMGNTRGLQRARARYAGLYTEHPRSDIGAGYREFRVTYDRKADHVDYDPDPA